MNLNINKVNTHEVNRHLTRTRILLGCFGGLVLAITAWGLDAYIIYQAHGFLPWVKLITGALIAIPLYGAAGYLAGRFGAKYYIALISFALSGYIIAWLATHLSYDWYESLLTVFDAGFPIPVHYEYDVTAQTRFSMTAAILIVISALFAFFYDGLVNQVYSALTAMNAIIGVLVVGVFFYASGYIVDNLNNASFRTPIVSTDRYIDRARLIQNGGHLTYPDQISWERTFLNLDVDLIVPYQLFISAYDPASNSAQVLVQLGEDWYDCMVVEEQPFTCSPIISSK